MHKRSLFVALGTCALLVGCNKNMPTIDKATAINRAKEIQDRQDNSNFVLPKNFVIRSNYVVIEDSRSEEGGKMYAKGSNLVIEEYDIENMRTRTYMLMTQEGISSSEKEIFTYYNKNEKLEYTLTNSNGYKTYTTNSMSEEAAKEKYKETQEEAGEKIKWRKLILSPDINGEKEAPKLLLQNYQEISDYYEGLHQEYLDDKNYYCNIAYGSSGPKDLQTIIELEIPSDTPGEDLIGTKTEKINVTLKNDLLSSITEKSIDYNEEKERPIFYEKEESDINVSVSYGSASIKIPDLAEYKKIEEPTSYGL